MGLFDFLTKHKRNDTDRQNKTVVDEKPADRSAAMADKTIPDPVAPVDGPAAPAVSKEEAAQPKTKAPEPAAPTSPAAAPAPETVQAPAAAPAVRAATPENGSTVLYRPGKEPPALHKRLDTLFAKLDEAYPDKQIVRLQAEHKKWSETITELYRKLGYASNDAFLTAYGYTVVYGKGGRPTSALGTGDNLLNTLKQRYPDGARAASVAELSKQNPDLAAALKTAANSAHQKLGMKYSDYLRKNGLLYNIVDPQEELDKLAARYKSTPVTASVKALKAQNQDLKWNAILKVKSGRELLAYINEKNGYAKPDDAPAAEVKMEPLMYADESDHFYNATEGRAKFIDLPSMLDLADGKRNNNATWTNVYELSHLIRKKDLLAGIQAGDSLSLVREPYAQGRLSVMTVDPSQRQRLGLLEDDLLAFYIDAGYLDVNSVKVAEIQQSRTETVTKRRRSPRASVMATYKAGGIKEALSFSVVDTKNYPEGMETLTPGCAVTFKQEPDDHSNKNAIAVCGPTGRTVGYVPDDLANKWGPLLNSSKMTELQGTVEDVHKAGIKTVEKTVPARLKVEIVFTYNDTLVKVSNTDDDLVITAPKAKLLNEYLAMDKVPAVETADGKTELLMYADGSGRYYNASDGRAKFIDLPPLFDPAAVKRQNNATVTNAFTLSELTDQKVLLAAVQAGEPLVLVREPFAEEGFATIAVYTHHGQRLGLIEDEELAYYIDAEYVDVSSIKAVDVRQSRTRTVERRVQNTMVSAAVTYQEGGEAKKVSFNVAGVNHYIQGVDTLQAGCELTFKREPDNPYSENAIAVCGPTGEITGHVPESMACQWAPMLDSGEMTGLHVTAKAVHKASTAVEVEDEPALLKVKIVFSYDDTLIVASNRNSDLVIVTPHNKMLLEGANNTATEDEGSAYLFAYYKDSIGDIMLALAEREFYQEEIYTYRGSKEKVYRVELNVDDDLCDLFKRERLVSVSKEAKRNARLYRMDCAAMLEMMREQTVYIQCSCREKFLADFVAYEGFSMLELPDSETPYIAHNLNWYLRSIGKQPVTVPPVAPKPAKTNPKTEQKATPASTEKKEILINAEAIAMPAAVAAAPQTAVAPAADGWPVYHVPEVEVKKGTGGWKFEEYTENGEKVYRLVDYVGKESHIIMPVKINKIRVVGIDTGYTKHPLFRKCTASEIEIPGCYGSINCWLLENNLYVRKITVGEGITKVGILCAGAQNLEEVNISRSVGSIDGRSFRSSRWYKRQEEYVAINDILIGYKGTGETMDVPAGITTIATQLNATLITTASGKQTKRYIKKIVLPDTVTTICEEAFNREEYVRVDTLEYTDSIRYIGPDALDRTRWLAKRRNEAVIFGKCLYWQGPRTGEITVPDGIELICGSCFKEAAITAVHLPASVKAIGAEAFASCSSLEKIEIPGTVTTIEAGAFHHCTALKEARLENGVEKLGKYAFYKCTSLEKVELPTSIVEIGDLAFSKCEQLAIIALPSSLQSLGCYAFEQCRKLEKIILPAGLTSVDGVFDGCTKLWDVTLPESCTRIGNYTFRACKSLTHIDLPPALAIIGQTAFSECASLTSIELPESVKELKDFAFNKCDSLTDIRLPAKLGWCAFKGCSNLQQVEFNAKTEDIGPEAFRDCASLKEIVLPQGVKTILPEAFENCTGLRSVKLPESIETIGAEAFKGCTALTDVEMPDKKIEIESSAFEGTPYQRKLDRRSAAEDRNAEAVSDFLITDGTLIEYVGDDAAVVVPDGVTAIGDKAFANARFIKSLALPDSVTEIGKNLFGYEYKRSYFRYDLFDDYPKWDKPIAAFSLTLGKNIRKIGDKAFACCDVGELTLPESLETIGDYAFAGNTAEVVRLPKSVKKVGAGAFYGAKELAVYDTLDPDAAEAAEWLYNAYNGKLNSTLSVALANPAEGFVEGQGNTVWCSCHIAVLAAETGAVKYRIWCEYNENRSYRALMYSAWGKNASFKFKEYDEHFKHAYNPAERTEMAFCRLQYPYQLAPEYRADYRAHLERCVYIEWAARRTARRIGQRDEVEQLALLKQYNALNARNARWLLEEFAACGAEKCTAFLQKLMNDGEVQ